MINYDFLRKRLCRNCLLDKEWNLHQQLMCLYIECRLSTRQISDLANGYISNTTVLRLLTRFNIPIREKGGSNNPFGRKGKVGD